MAGKDKVVKCCGATEAKVELTEHPDAAEWVVPWALETIARKALRRSEFSCCGLAPIA